MELPFNALKATTDRDRRATAHAATLPGVVLRQLTTHVDERGCLTEFFRDSWGSPSMCQWTALSLGIRTIRGPSVHRKHTDAVAVVAGMMRIGFRDLREKSPMFRRAFELTLAAPQPMLVIIPPGVMHTFYATTQSALVIVGNTHDYDPDDDIKCPWREAGIDIPEGVIGAIDSDAVRPLDEIIAALADIELTG
jgi:dTDP-4-dehydrorhamnose 3,5-epimerase-like enzyme